MKKDNNYRVINHESGYTEFSCIGGLGCPQIKIEKDKVILRSSLRIDDTVCFSKSEWEILKSAIKNQEDII